METVEIDKAELERLRSQANAWEQCFFAIKDVDNEAFRNHGGTGSQAAVAAIARFGAAWKEKNYA